MEGTFIPTAKMKGTSLHAFFRDFMLSVKNHMKG